ncbi:lipocalin-like domain-containing protein [Thalassotalea fusca]
MMSRLFGKYIVVLLIFVAVIACENKQNDTVNHNPIKELANNSGDYQRPSKSNIILFPAAHAPKKSYRQEWWYLTANLVTEKGEQLGAQWTLFRRAVGDKHWYFAHAALGDSAEHKSAYRDGREELGNVSIQLSPFRATIDDWQWHSSSDFLPATLSFGSGQLAAAKEGEIVESNAEQGWRVNLQLSAEPYFFLQGAQGFSQKHHTLDISSHYYSQPFIKVSGQVYWQGGWQRVTGDAWLDREWGSQLLAEDQQGWDWFSLRLDANTALMVYRIRSITQDYLYGSIMRRDGTISVLNENDIRVTRVKDSTSKAGYPQAFRIVLVEQGVDIDVNVVNNQQVMRFGIEYFEGVVNFSGSHQGSGFLEMTGYQ